MYYILVLIDDVVVVDDVAETSQHMQFQAYGDFSSEYS
jgi:hypothetical protein